MKAGDIMSPDKNLQTIKHAVTSILPGSRVILFGSRARGIGDHLSDYDVLVVTGKNFNIRERRQYAGKIRRKLAVLGIAVDIVVKTENDVSYYQDKIGSLVREAVRDGVAL
jgi:predicted nucleotidyltransferase